MWRLSNIHHSPAGSITEPVELADVKAWIRGLEDTTEVDDLITSMIKPAREDIENYIDAKLVGGSVSLYVETTEDTDELTSLPFALNIPSTLTVTKIVRGETPEVMVLDDDYYLNGSLSFYSVGRYKLEYELTEEVPETIKEAIKMLVAYRYGNPGDQEKGEQQGIPEDVISKIFPYKKM